MKWIWKEGIFEIRRREGKSGKVEMNGRMESMGQEERHGIRRRKSGKVEEINGRMENMGKEERYRIQQRERMVRQRDEWKGDMYLEGGDMQN